MRRLSVIVTAALLLACSAGLAQVNLPGMSTPDTSAMPLSGSMGVPAPTGAMGTDAPVGGAGIPLGATELFAGGLSPAPTDVTTTNPACPGAGPNPGVGALGTGSIFQADGTMATSTSDLASSGDPTDFGCSVATSAGGGPLGLTSTLGTAPAFAGGAIPLGATALSTTGLGGTIGLAAPGSSSPCNGPGSLTMAGTVIAAPTTGSAATPGMPTANGC
jgi:hypothetical protein